MLYRSICLAHFFSQQHHWQCIHHLTGTTTVPLHSLRYEVHLCHWEFCFSCLNEEQGQQQERCVGLEGFLVYGKEEGEDMETAGGKCNGDGRGGVKPDR